MNIRRRFYAAPHSHDYEKLVGGGSHYHVLPKALQDTTTCPAGHDRCQLVVGEANSGGAGHGDAHEETAQTFDTVCGNVRSKYCHEHHYYKAVNSSHRHTAPVHQDHYYCPSGHGWWCGTRPVVSGTSGITQGYTHRAGSGLISHVVERTHCVCVAESVNMRIPARGTPVHAHKYERAIWALQPHRHEYMSATTCSAGHENCVSCWVWSEAANAPVISGYDDARTSEV